MSVVFQLNLVSTPSGAHPVSDLTRAGPAGYGIRQSGSFIGKNVQSLPRPDFGQLTRAGPAGYGIRPTGSFTGEGEVEEEGLDIDAGRAGHYPRPWRYTPPREVTLDEIVEFEAEVLQEVPLFFPPVSPEMLAAVEALQREVLEAKRIQEENELLILLMS